MDANEVRVRALRAALDIAHARGEAGNSVDISARQVVLDARTIGDYLNS